MTEVERLLSVYRGQGVLVDTRLLLVFLVGSVDRALVGSHPPTTRYAPADYDAIARILEEVPGRLITTGSILTEVSNLLFLRGLPSERRADFAEALRGFLALSQEHRRPNEELAALPELPSLGLTHAGVLVLARTPYLVLTDDSRLTTHLRAVRADVLDLASIRSLL